MVFDELLVYPGFRDAFLQQPGLLFGNFSLGNFFLLAFFPGQLNPSSLFLQADIGARSQIDFGSQRLLGAGLILVSDSVIVVDAFIDTGKGIAGK